MSDAHASYTAENIGPAGNGCPSEPVGESRAARRASGERGGPEGRGIGLTRRQRDCLLFVQSFVERHGCSPSFTQIAEAMGLSSKSEAYRLIDRLIERRKIVKVRSGLLEVIEPARGTFCFSVRDGVLHGIVEASP